MEFHSPRRSRSVPALEHRILSADQLDAGSRTSRSRSPCRCQCTCHSATVNLPDLTSKNQRDPELVTKAELHQIFLDNEARRDQEAIEHRNRIWQDLEQRLALLSLTKSHSEDADDILRQKEELAREREALEAERELLRVKEAQRARVDELNDTLTEIRDLLVALFDCIYHFNISCASHYQYLLLVLPKPGSVTRLVTTRKSSMPFGRLHKKTHLNTSCPTLIFKV